MLKVGLIGASGTISKHHIQALTWLKEENIAELVVCCDTHPENLKVEGVKVYTDFNELLEKEKGNLDFLDICVPTFLHKDFAVKAMKEGYNVICEKPMALSYEDCMEMVNAQKETGKKFMIAHCMRWNLPYNRVKSDYIDGGKFGKLLDIKFCEYTKGLPVGADGWFKNLKLSGGSLIDFHIHDIDSLIYMLGVPDSVSSIGKRNEYGEYTVISSNLLFGDVCVNFQANWGVKAMSPEHGRVLRFDFENGNLFINNRDGFTEVDENGVVTKFEIQDQRSGYYREIKYFIDCIKNDCAPEYCKPEDSAMAIKVALSEAASADKRGEIIKFK